MRGILTDLGGSELARANEENLCRAFTACSHLPQVEVRNDGGILRYATGILHPVFNGVLRTQLSPGDIDARIRETLAYFKARNLPITWWVGPSTRPEDLGKHLASHGLVHTFDSPGMAVDLLALREDLSSSPGLTIDRLGSIEALREWMQPFASGSGLSGVAAEGAFDLFADLGLGPDAPYSYHVARLSGEPVATSMMFPDSSVAGIYCVATVPRARRQGIGTAVTLAALREARALGYRIAILQSSPMGVGVYSKLGFKECCRFGHYEWAGRTF